MCASTHVHTLQTDCPRLSPSGVSLTLALERVDDEQRPFVSDAFQDFPHERFFLRRRDRRFHTVSRHGLPMGSIELAGAFLPRETKPI
jgi:hypothetical protein